LGEHGKRVLPGVRSPRAGKGYRWRGWCSVQNGVPITRARGVGSATLNAWRFACQPDTARAKFQPPATLGPRQGLTSITADNPNTWCKFSSAHSHAGDETGGPTGVAVRFQISGGGRMVPVERIETSRPSVRRALVRPAGGPAFDNPGTGYAPPMFARTDRVGAAESKKPRQGRQPEIRTGRGELKNKSWRLCRSRLRPTTRSGGRGVGNGRDDDRQISEPVPSNVGAVWNSMETARKEVLGLLQIETGAVVPNANSTFSPAGARQDDRGGR